MSQGTLQVANQGFPGFRTDLNAALSALNSKNSGTSAPSALAAGQSWLDTATGTRPVLKQYDGADWVEVVSFDTNGNRAYRGTQYAAAGGSGSPSHSIESDTDTGWYLKAANTPAFQAAGRDVLVMGTAGVQKPANPAFHVFKSSASTNVTGTGGTAYAINFGSERFDIGGNVTGGTFMAPVDGKYHFDATLDMQGFGTGATNASVQLVTSNELYLQRFNPPLSDINIAASISSTVDMEAGDTAYVSVFITGMASAGVDVNGNGAGAMITYFSGHLVG